MIVVGLLMWTRPILLRDFWNARLENINSFGVVTHLLGLVIAFIPVFLFSSGMDASLFFLAIGILGVGAGLLIVGLLQTNFSISSFFDLVKGLGLSTFLIAICAFVSFDVLQSMSGVFWAWQPITDMTFNAVVRFLEILGQTPEFDFPAKIIGVNTFLVQVANTCSGIEGFGLVTFYLAVFFWMCREHLNFKRAWILFPIGILLSWCLNTLRIVVLILIGANGNPDLAVNGFHSHAGWLAFTLLAGILSYVTWNIGWFRTKASLAAQRKSDRTSFFADEKVAEILPFLVFMLASLLVSTFTQETGLHYWVKVLFISVVLLLVRKYLRALPWEFDAISLIAGVAIAVLWVATGGTAPSGDELSVRLAAMPVSLFVLWVALRLLGTTILIPIAEELFFRKYLFTFLTNERNLLFVLSVVLSTIGFAALHDRWVVAAIAGIAFGLLYLRKNNITHAIQSHMLANLLIGMVAVFLGHWSMI